MDLDTDVSRSGTYSCFCWNELVNLDKNANTNYTIPYNYGTEEKTEPICSSYNDYALKNGFFIAQGYS